MGEREDRATSGIRGYLASLRSWQLLVVSAALLVVNLLVPDPIPFVDEALLAVLTFLLARWKKRIL